MKHVDLNSSLMPYGGFVNLFFRRLAEQSRIVRLPLNRVGSLNKISKTFSELEQKYEREPSPEELAEVLDVTTAEVVDTMKISGRHVSMDAPFVQGEENSLLDVLENDSEETPDSGLMNDSLRREVQRALSTLTQREADVITLVLRPEWRTFHDPGRDRREIQPHPRDEFARLKKRQSEDYDIPPEVKL